MSRTIVLHRERKLLGGGVPWTVFLDNDERLGIIENGEEIKITVSDSRHVIYWSVKEPTPSGGTQTVWSENVYVYDDGKSHYYDITLRSGLFRNKYIYFENEDKTYLLNQSLDQ